jgi:hypothetical protein
MGDKVGRVYVDSQDLSTLQARKFKGLKGHNKKRSADEEGGAETAVAAGGDVAEVDGKVGGGEGRKRAKKAE